MAQSKDKTTPDLYRCALRANAHKNLYLNAQLSDVNFVFYESQNDASKSETRNEEIPVVSKKIIEKIPAQKCVLASVCEVFFAMFYGPVKMEGDVDIFDVSPEAMKEFLQCFYLDSVRFTEENIADVIKLAHKYCVTECMDTCVAFLVDIVTPIDIFWIYPLAIYYSLCYLKVFCEQVIALNIVQVFGSADFLDCDRVLLKEILSLKLMPCSETVILDSCFDWAKKACEKAGLDADNAENLRAQLGDCLSLIRFGTISMEELCKRRVVYDGLFSSMTVDSQTKRFWWSPLNSWKCRRAVTTSALSPYYMDSTEVIYFTSNKTALLGGIYSAGLTSRKGIATKRSARITVREIPGKSFNLNVGTILYRGYLMYGNNELPHVQLPIAILIDERNTYAISFDMTTCNDLGTSVVYGSNKVNSDKGLTIEFIFDAGRGQLISALDMNHI